MSVADDLIKELNSKKKKEFKTERTVKVNDEIVIKYEGKTKIHSSFGRMNYRFIGEGKC